MLRVLLMEKNEEKKRKAVEVTAQFSGLIDKFVKGKIIPNDETKKHTYFYQKILMMALILIRALMQVSLIQLDRQMLAVLNMAELLLIK